MAYLSGTKHRLFIREESTYGSLGVTGDNDNASRDANTQNWINQFNCYTRPGAKLTVQNNPLIQGGIGIPSAIGRGRSTVSGSFSFYLPKVDVTGGATAQTQGFLLFFKHLYGEVTRSGSGASVDLDDTRGMPFNGTNLKWIATLSKFDTVKDHKASSSGNMNAADTESSFSFISYFNDKHIYLYTGVCPISMSISAPDANSLVTVDVSFIARSVNRLFYESANNGSFKVLNDPYYDLNGNKTEVDSILIDQVTNRFFANGTSDSLLMRDSFVALNTELTLKFKNGISGETTFTTNTNNFQASGISININKPLSFTNQFGARVGTQTDINSRIFQTKRPVMTGNKSISGSFNMPILSNPTLSSGETSNTDYSSLIERVSQGLTNEQNIYYKIKFTESGTTALDTYEFEFDNIVFGSTDFGNIDTNITTTSLNWTAIPKTGNDLLGDRHSKVTYSIV
tara:strand:- start:113 stop:1480 length:1368 start_codon:yes stop_codon:yes gene_type:complete